MKIRNYSQEDLPLLLEFVNLSMELDDFSPELLKENINEDPDFNENLTLLALEGEQIVGFLMGVVREREEEYIGYVKLMAVHPEFRRRGIASRLYREVESKLKNMGASKVRVYESYPNYYMPGIDPFYTEAVCFFERLGYKKFGDTSNLEADLENQVFDTEDEEKEKQSLGITIKRADESDFNEMITWTDTYFKAWINEVKKCFKNDPISIHIAKLNDKIIAFSAYESNNLGTGWFGPMGTSPEARGKGVGGTLLRRCLNDLKRLGFKKSIIPWVGPIPFYMHYVGSKVKRVFWRYEKILE